MKKFFKLLIPIIIILTLTLVGCDGDGRNPISHEKVPVITAETEEPTKAEEEKDVDATQKMYEEMFSDAFTMKPNSENLIATISKEDSNVLEVEQSSSGDSKNVIYVGDDAKYVIYKIGENSYLEIHVSEYKNSDGETKEAEDLYYNITNNKFESYLSSSEDFNMDKLTESLQLSTENVPSIKYLGKQDIHGTECRAVEIKNRIEEGGDVIHNESFFYFSEWNIMFGCKFSTSDSTIDCYFPDSLKIELPNDVEFVEVEDSVISEKILALKSDGLFKINLY